MPKLIVASVKMLYRDKQALFWAMMFPIIFAAVFGLFDLDGGPEIHVGVMAEQPSALGDRLLGGLKRVPSFEVERRTDLATARRELGEGDFDLVVAVPATRPGTSSAVPVYYDPRNAGRNQAALAAIRQIVDGMNLEIAGVSSPSLTVEPTTVRARSAKYYDFLLPGLVGMGVMNFAITGMAISITRFREQRILKRILATPLEPVRFLAAQVIARLVLSVVQAGLILAVGIFVFGANIDGNLLWLFILSATANLIFLNLGFAVAGRAPNPEAAQGIAQAVALPMTFLSGVFFPLDTLPGSIHAVVQYLPLTPLLEALRVVANDGQSITAAGSQLAQLAAWIAGSFFLATRSFRFAARA
jgi:ABC-2 type transport system permease protein